MLFFRQECYFSTATSSSGTSTLSTLPSLLHLLHLLRQQRAARIPSTTVVIHTAAVIKAHSTCPLRHFHLVRAIYLVHLACPLIHCHLVRAIYLVHPELATQVHAFYLDTFPVLAALKHSSSMATCMDFDIDTHPYCLPRLHCCFHLYPQ